MLLGGIRYLLPVIEAAHRLGYYVITCDYIPDNIAHRYSDEYVNVSIIDQEAVLAVARQHQIDGIMSFGVDPGVVAAAYVQQEMRLPAFGPYESVCILQNKDRFRQFLSDHGFNVPQARSYTTEEAALADTAWYHLPMIVKPTDSAGSKGVTRIDILEQLPDAVQHAFANSISKSIIIEEFIEKAVHSSDTDCFSVDGELRFVSFSAQRFDEYAAGTFVPAAYSWPSAMSTQQKSALRADLQRLITLLDMRTTVYNVETRIGTNGKPYIMEVSPRGGGNRLCEMLRYATGTDLITAACQAAVGDTITDIMQRPYCGHWAEVVLHAPADGTFLSLDIAPSMQPYLVETDLWVGPGDEVHAFRGANDSLGTLVLNFPDAETLETALATQPQWIKVNVK